MIENEQQIPESKQDKENLRGNKNKKKKKRKKRKNQQEQDKEKAPTAEDTTENVNGKEDTEKDVEVE